MNDSFARAGQWGDGVKLFIRQMTSGEGTSFTVLDEQGRVRYTVPVETEKRRQRLQILSGVMPVAEIVHRRLIVQYFTVRCDEHFYALVPYQKEFFTFAMYGSSYRFAGNMAEGRFSLFDVDKSPVMTQKKCWGAYGAGFELQIYREDREVFSLAVALCAAMYLSAAEEDPVLSG